MGTRRMAWRRGMVVVTFLTLLGSTPLWAGRTIQFSDHLIQGDCGYAYGVAGADIDGDGDLDLTAQDVRGKVQLADLYWTCTGSRTMVRARSSGTSFIRTSPDGWSGTQSAILAAMASRMWLSSKIRAVT